MSLFQPKLNPFSDFSINLGPLYVERVFDGLLTLQGIKQVALMGASERFDRYLDYLRTNSGSASWSKYTVMQFLKGHFCQQKAIHATCQLTARHFQEKALCYYQLYLELSNRPTESRYYGQWQVGILQDKLKYPWEQSEYALLQASLTDPLRAEALKAMVSHYVGRKEWEKAYWHSKIALERFFGKSPAADRRWFVDPTAYNWKILDTHLTICYKMGNLSEAMGTFYELRRWTFSCPEEVETGSIHRLRALQRVFEKNRTKSGQTAMA